jgi:putative transposase
MNAVAQQLHAEGRVLPWTQLCRLLDMPRSTLYYQPRPRKRSEAVDETIAAQIREIIEERPAFGVRRVHVQLTRGRGLVVNCKKVRRIMRLKHWTLRHRPVGRRPRAEKRVSIAERPDERWATDLAYVPCGRDGHAVFAPVIDSCTREVLGWELAPTGRAATAARALEDALLARFGTLHGAPAGLRLRHDNGLVFGSRQYVSLVRGYGLTQEYIAPHTPEQNGLCERFMRTLKEEPERSGDRQMRSICPEGGASRQCVWLQNFTSLEDARARIGDFIDYYNTRRFHQALNYNTPKQQHTILTRDDKQLV